MKKALICGVSGQDGAYLAELLLSKGYQVYGTSRDAQMSSFTNLKRLGIYEKVHKVSMSPTDFRNVLQVLDKVVPDEVYNLAGQSSVALSFEQPVEALESISLGTLNLLEAIRVSDAPTKLYNAGSSECFGNTGDMPADENSPFRPRSPYGVAKAAAFWEVSNYREAYGMFACSGLLFNHESPLRPERFVTQKIATAVNRIANGSGETLLLGNINIERDWGWAPEYVEAMWRMLQQDEPNDYVIATGETHSLQEFADIAFKHRDLDWRKHVRTNPELFRTAELTANRANPARAKNDLDWQPKKRMAEVACAMVEATVELGRERLN